MLLSSLNSYNVPLNCSVQLHIFCDASVKGLFSVAYFIIENQDNVELSFVLARSRVAPLQASTIPRLKLQTAVLGSKIASLVYKHHKMEITQTYFWTDSRVVWSWLQVTNKQKSVYIANRVKEILSDSEGWKWLPSSETFADEATINPTVCLNNNCRWLQGPAFLW